MAMNVGLMNYLKNRGKSKGSQVGSAKRFVNKSNYGQVMGGQEKGEGTPKEEKADMMGQ